MDPDLVATTTGLEVAGYAYDSLIGRTADGKLVPRLASKWTATPTSVTLTLRKDVTCSDGSKLTPSVVAANFKRLEDPKTQSPYVANFLGSTEYKVSADDAAGTVTLHLPHPFGALEYNLAFFPKIICSAGLKNPQMLQQHSDGTGPFVLAQHVSGDHYTFDARKGYDWGPDGASTSVSGFPSQVTLRVVPNETTAANEMLSGQLNIAALKGPDRARLAASSQFTSQETPTGVTGLFFNEAKGRPGADPKVREALTQALDREAMTQAGFGEFGEVANSFLLPTFAPCYSAEAGEAIGSTDPAAAERLLAGKSLKLKVYSISVPASEYVSSTWAKLGVETELNAGDETGPGLDIVFGGGDWDASLFSLDGIEQLGVIAPFFEGSPPPDGQNIGSVENPAFTVAAEKANDQVGKAACTASTEAEQSLYGAYDAIPLSVQTIGVFADKSAEFSIVSTLIDPTSLRSSGS